ncbi:MAG: fibronectin type III domain-containing protein [Anaerovoracaceae bacterium]|jgi:hypothetical protein
MKVKTKIGIILAAALMMILAACMSSYATDGTTGATSIPDDGEYTMAAITCLDAGHMFNVAKADCNTCKVTVENGEATAHLRMNGTGYDYLYLGTAEEADAALQSTWITYTEDEDGKYVFDIPVTNLNKSFDLAAHSTSSGNWFERSLMVFQAELTTTLSSVKAGPCAAVVTWKKQDMTNLTGYAIQYSTQKDFSDYKTVYVKMGNTSTTIKDLEPGTKYYVRVTTYRHFDQDASKRYNYTFQWSDAKTVTPSKDLSKTKIKSLKAGKKKATVTISKKSGYKYQIRYSRKSSMKSAKSIKTSSTKKTVKKLKSKKRYYFQVRTYKKIGGTTFYSDWSSKKSVKVK